MQSLRKSNLGLLALLCAAVLVTRVAGVHLHLCLDGQEAPVVVHVEDAGVHADHDVSQSHSDVELSLVGDTLAKKSANLFDLPALLAAALALFVLSLIRDPVRLRRAPLPVVSAARFLRPPLRAPPL